MKALRMLHDKDPTTDLWEKVQSSLSDIPQVLGASVLVALYLRPEKTAGGISLPDKYREEDIYQGKVGLILKMGPLAFVEDDRHKWPGRVPVVGEWVVFRVGDAWPLIIAEHHCRILEDVSVKMIISRPDLMY